VNSGNRLLSDKYSTSTVASFVERVSSTIEMLEAIAADRALLDQLSSEDRERLHRAVAEFYNPDPIARRRMVKAAERERSAIQAQRIGALRHGTGIQMLRRRPVFTTPNCFPPSDFEQRGDENPDTD